MIPLEHWVLREDLLPGRYNLVNGISGGLREQVDRQNKAAPWLRRDLLCWTLPIFTSRLLNKKRSSTS